MKTYCSPFRRLFCLLLLVAHPLRAKTTAKDSTGTIAAAAVATDTGEDTQAAPWPPHEKCATGKLQHYLLENLTEQDLRLVTTKTLCSSECVDSCTCLSSSLDHVMNVSRRLTQGCTIVVHTIATGVGVNQLHQPKHPLPNPEHPNQTCYVAIVEKASSLWIASGNRHGQWHLIAIDGTLPFKSSRKFSRVFKMAPALFFDAGVQYAIWLDSKLQLRVTAESLAAKLRHPGPHNQTHALMVAVQHKVEDIDHNVGWVLSARRRWRPGVTDFPDLLEQQLTYYLRQQRDPSLQLHYNLQVDAALLVHHLQSSYARQLRCAWYWEYMAWADRDQLPFTYVVAQWSAVLRAPDQRNRVGPSGKRECWEVSIYPRVALSLVSLVVRQLSHSLGREKAQAWRQASTTFNRQSCIAQQMVTRMQPRSTHGSWTWDETVSMQRHVNAIPFVFEAQSV